MSFLYIFDLTGTFVFAVSGALLGVKKDMDIYGLFVLSLAVAVGGGTVRDMMLGVHPFVLRDPNYLLCTVSAVLLVAFFNRRVERGIQYLVAMDAVGLGVFTVIGFTKAFDAGLGWYAAIFLSTLTSTGGGMIRDVLAGDVPFVLRKEVYASASIAGSLLLLICRYFSVPVDFAAIAAAVFVTFIRLITYKKQVHLPKLKINSTN